MLEWIIMKRQQRHLTKKRNFRDLNYLTLPNGEKLVPGVFFRGARLKKLSKGVIRHFQSLDLKTVIDLRTPAEISKKPDTKIEGVTYYEFPIVKAEMMGITHEKGLKGFKEPPDMTILYPLIVTAEESVAALKKVFAVIFDLDREGAVLWHCTEGKDRAGVVSALFLYALGYKLDDIYEDYEKSNARSEKKGKLYRFLIRLLMRNKPLAEAVYKVMLAKREYLICAFKAIEEKFGSLDSYVANQLGLTPEKILAFKKKFMLPV